MKRGVQAGNRPADGGTRPLDLARWAWEDTVATVRDWRPPERPQPEDAGRAARRRSRRAPEPTWGRTDAALMARRLLQRRGLFPLLTALGRPEVVGRHHVEAARPPLIIAPNHVSHADAPVVLQALPERLRDRTIVPAAADYFFARRWLSVLVTLAMNAVPFDRRHDIADSVRRCERFLRHGLSIVLFPEGTRSTDGRLRGFKAGVAHLAVQTGAEVVPVYVRGTHALLPRGARLPRPSALTVHFGAPMRAERDESARQFNERLERAVADLAAAARGHAQHELPARPVAWRERWLRDRAVAVGDAGAGAAAGEGAGWIARWRSTTPR